MTRCYAHRGFSGVYPENSLLAFQTAIATGCDGIELDVQLTRDAVPVVIHDETVDRVTNGKGQVKDLTLAQLKQLLIHATDLSQEQPQQIPTLEAYFELVKHQPVMTNIELKNSSWYYEYMEQDVINLVRRYELSDRIIFSSFNHASMLLCHELAPDIPTALLTDQPSLGNIAAFAQALGCSYLHPYYPSVDEALLTSCHDRGIGVNTWTVNQAADMARLQALGVDGLITNYPDLALTVLRSR
ncbi:MAG: glycerophosphodiester phosphodiesterase [Oscillospiraceae bacterium]|nr:glycerophosphodiester phosphodiesterase [Oscillospiraceae bacterium]MDD4368483.1 glycerophosphodiester phosphodiesterase [Oscillospiraceae bacterium]